MWKNTRICLSLFMVIISLHYVISSFHTSSIYKQISNVIHKNTNAYVYLRGSPYYEKKRKVKNGLCKYIFPDMVVAPKSVEDVSRIVKITRNFDVPLSVRSGGHSFLCQSIKPVGIQLDMRRMNKVRITTREPFENHGPAAILGPGSTWRRVLKYIPKDRFTMIHGQCTSVGVAGYILGGGVNIMGTSQRYLSAAANVLQYTLVDAEGRILKVSANNLTEYNPITRRYESWNNDHGLFSSLQLAGSSFGIVTEFHYRIFNGAEVLPVFVLVYIENELDISNFEAAATNGRYHMCLHNILDFTSHTLLELELLPQTIGKLFLRFLPKIQQQKVRPLFIAATDNFPFPGQSETNKDDVYEFLRSFGLKIAVDGKIADFLQDDGLLYDYESLYQTKGMRNKDGPRPLISANFQNITRLSSISNLLLNHPLFGYRNAGTQRSANAGCEFCYMSLVVSVQDIERPEAIRLIENNDAGKFVLEMTCLYKPNVRSRCPKVVRNAKEVFRNAGIRHGERFAQYPNTPSCDSTNDFQYRYWSSQNIEIMTKAKQFWDPQNVFNHCQSFGSKQENCCPRDM